VKILELITNALKSHKNVVTIIVAGLLMELISAGQYYYTRSLMKKQLDYRVESELQNKAVLIKGVLNLAENTMNEHLWDINRNIAQADSMFDAAQRIIENSPNAEGMCLAFVPYYYPEKGRLFEPYATRSGGKIVVKQLGSEGEHDYTKHPAYQQVEKTMKPFWSDPYEYESDSEVKSLTTYSYPLTDKDGKLIAVGGLDFSLQQIGDTLNVRHLYDSAFGLLLTESGELISGPHEGHPRTHDIEQVVRLINDSTMTRGRSESGLSKVVRMKSEVDGDKAIVYYGSIHGNPHWKLAMVCYDKEVYEELEWMGLQMAALMLLCLLLLAFIILRYAGSERKLIQAQEEQRRIASELSIAKEIQMGMLPKEFPPHSDHRDIEVYGSLLPAREVGGDIYDFFLRNEKLFFCIGDVSGKGVPSAIVMAEIHSQFRMASIRENNPAHIMQTLNSATCEGNEKNIFVTLFIGVLDFPTGRLRYCNAGHDVPYLICPQKAQQLTALPVTANLPIGVFDDFKYQMQQTDIDAGTTIFLYTDGLTEAKNWAHNLMGIERVENGLKNEVHASPQQLIEAMAREVSAFTGQAEQSDDLTMLAVKYAPHKEEYVEQEEITLVNDVAHVVTLNNFVKEITGKLDIDTSKARNIRLAVEEAVVNVMNYAYPAGEKGMIKVQAMYNEQKLKFVIRDTGVSFDPTEANLADTSLSAEERPVGGLGLLLVHDLMDSINYERMGKENVLTLITYYTKGK